MINTLKNISMKQFTEFMHNLSGALMLFGQTLISAFFVIVILILVLAVEIQRVAHGILLFEQSHNLAYLGAFVLVMLLLTLEFVVHYIETKHGYQEQQKTEFSLRSLYSWWIYFTAWESKNTAKWEARYKSPAQSIRGYSQLLTMTILALALGGSMADTIGAVDGNWMQGIQAIAVESSLLEIVRWSGGLLFALALVIGAQRLTAYVAQRASETLIKSDGGLQVIKQEKSTQEHDIAIVDINQGMADWIVSPDDLHSISCPNCDWSGDSYKSKRAANLALQAHRRHCDVYSS